ncbi:MAG: S46 family peptidase [candidate division Zixibacteria bacterium]|nr:S46 family peptidase [candidate division Zixibacteria bacterium]
MFKKILLALLVLFLWGFLSLNSLADEGMWLLDSIDKLPIDSLKAKGLKLNPEEIYNPKGGGISDAVVQIGATSSFVSPEGLIITNHHVAFGAIQRQSTPEHNYLRDGFYAKTREEEIPAIGTNVYITKSFKDVTDKVLKVVNEKMSDLERYKAIEKITKKIIKECEKGEDIRCRLASMYEGKEYYLFASFKIRDVRLVFAPPRSIGDYGGEIDNWMWPRHAGDFSILRAYVSPDGKSTDYSKENVPYNSKTYLKISSAGVKEGDFVMLMGFPGSTSRYESSFFIDNMLNHDYPQDIQTRLDLISILEKSSAEDSLVAIRLSSTIKGLYNRLKKYRGMLDGFKRTGLLQKKRGEEKLLAEFLNKNPELKTKYGQVLSELDNLYKENKKYQDKEFLMDWMTSYTDFLDFASTIYKWSLEKEKKDFDREPGYQNRDTSEIKGSLKEAQINLVPSVDKKVLTYFLLKAFDLPVGRKILAIEKIFTGKEKQDKEKIIEDFVNNLYRNTKLGSLEARLKMFSMSRKELEKQGDLYINFAKDLEVEREEIRIRNKEFSGALKRLQPKLIQAYAEWKKEKLYPDANGTIRFNYGEVKGYVPKDAVDYKYITTLSGVMEKNTGEEPFDAPKELQDVYNKKDFGSYFNKTLGDVPVDFLSTNDITNGNSGSPVMNGKGELVGLAFDGNYEAMTSDYEFDPEITRSINVDIRYVLFLLDKVYHAEGLLKELTVH